MSEGGTNESAVGEGTAATPTKASKPARKRAAKPRPAPKVVAFAEALAGAAAVAEAEIEQDRLVPQLSLADPVSVLARRCGQLLRREALFRTPTDDVVTVDLTTGARKVMTPARFCSFLEGFVVTGKTGADGEFKAASMPLEMAFKILSADVFREQLRLLRGTLPVRVPGWANAEKTKVRLLPAGYDEATECLVLDGVPFEETRAENEALQWLQRTHQMFPWGDAPGAAGDESQLSGSRAFAGHVVACLTHFCALLRGTALRPCMTYLANQQGSGKSLLAFMGVAATHGAAHTTTWPSEEGERGKVLTTLANEGRPYALIDNAKGFLSSAELEAFLTSPVRVGRLLGRSEMICAPNVAQVVLTGNGLRMSPDLARRSLVIDLFYPGEATERRFPQGRLLTEGRVASVEFRREMLASLWAMVRTWGELGCPGTEKRSAPGRVLPSFETFSRLFGGITAAFGLADPFARPEEELDEISGLWERLLGSLAEDVASDAPRRFTGQEVLERLEELGLTGELLGDAVSKSTTLGRRLKPWLGRELTDARGRLFSFGTRRGGAGQGYLVTILKDAQNGAEAAA